MNLPVGKKASSRNVQKETTRRIDEPEGALGTRISNTICMRTLSELGRGATARGRRACGCAAHAALRGARA
eukprot:6174990-Pleurochrysis_carterae.AAC.1